MKKIMYGMLVLIGGVLIASNFMIDSSKVDHKTASASGVACKWISESGYGVGPLYIDEPNKNISSIDETGKISVKETSKQEDNIFNMFPCTSDNSGDNMDGNFLYNKDKTKYDGYFSISETRHVSASSTTYYIFSVDDGKIVSYNQQTSDSKSTPWVFESISRIVKDYNFNNFRIDNKITYVASIASQTEETKFIDFQKLNYNISDSTFTCVCAEY